MIQHDMAMILGSESFSSQEMPGEDGRVMSFFVGRKNVTILDDSTSDQLAMAWGR